MRVFNTGVIFTTIEFILCRKYMGAQWTGGHEFWYTLEQLGILNKHRPYLKQKRLKAVKRWNWNQKQLFGGVL